MLTASEHAALGRLPLVHGQPGRNALLPRPAAREARRHAAQLAEKNLVVKEQFAGGYSLTRGRFQGDGGQPSVGDVPIPSSSRSAASHSARRR